VLAGILIAAAAAGLGLVVLVLLALRLWQQVRSLSRRVGESSRRLDAATAPMDAGRSRWADPA
jgi:hypothetical protein